MKTLIMSNSGDFTRAIIFCSSLLFSLAQPARAATDEVIRLNNDGVKALNDKNFPVAIKYLESAIAMDPDYKLSRQNLAIVYSNLGFQSRHQPRYALRMFHRAMAIDPENLTTRQNLSGMIVLLGREPHSFQDRLEFALEAKLEGDLMSSIIEFQEAEKIKRDEYVENQLQQLYKSPLLSIPPFAPYLAGIDLSQKEIKEGIINSTAELLKARLGDEIDFGPYMARLQADIKRHWKPPYSDQRFEIVLVFQVLANGGVENLKVITSSGKPDQDEAAIKAVKGGAPFVRLPEGSPSREDIKFSFTYNNFSKLTALQTNPLLGPKGELSFALNLRHTAKRSYARNEKQVSYTMPVAFDYLPVVSNPLPQFPRKEDVVFDSFPITSVHYLIPPGSGE